MSKGITYLGIGVLVGYILNTETSKKTIQWASKKARTQIDNLVKKVNEVTEENKTE